MDTRARNARYDEQYFVFIVYVLCLYIQIGGLDLQRHIPHTLILFNLPILFLSTVVIQGDL
jgi:hypothetical protein